MKLTTILLLSSSILLATCSTPKTEVEARPFLVICFDVEDYTSPESVGMDDIPKWIAETMTNVGVTGTFFVIGEKARSLEARGRRDVIEAMARHDIGSHTNFGSIHPTVTEILEHASFDAGVETMLENEGAGFDDLPHEDRVGSGLYTQGRWRHLRQGRSRLAEIFQGAAGPLRYENPRAR